MKKKPTAAAELFTSFKTSLAIPATRPLRRDFMIQATLDGGLRSIGYHPAVALDHRVLRVDAIIVDRDDGRYAIDFEDARPETDPAAEGLLALAFGERCTGIMTVTAADVRGEPRLSAARAVWRFASVNINAGDRAQVIDALQDEGPMPLRALDGLTATSRDVADVVYALACKGVIDLDLTRGLDGRTIVRTGIVGGLRLRYRA